MTKVQRKQLARLIDAEFLFARDMFFAPVNHVRDLVLASLRRAQRDADKSSKWSLDG